MDDALPYPADGRWVLVARHVDDYQSDSSNPTHTTGTEYCVYDLNRFENGKLFESDWRYAATTTKTRGGFSGVGDTKIDFVDGQVPPAKLCFGQEVIECVALRKHERGGAAWKYELVDGVVKKVLKE